MQLESGIKSFDRMDLSGAKARKSSYRMLPSNHRQAGPCKLKKQQEKSLNLKPEGDDN
jgi:hypothetical protein